MNENIAFMFMLNNTQESDDIKLVRYQLRQRSAKLSSAGNDGMTLDNSHSNTALLLTS